MRFSALWSITLLATIACSTQPAVDLAAERTALLNADRAWAAAYAQSASPPDAFIAQLVDDAYLLPPDAPLTQGKDAIREVVAELEGMPGFSVTWEANAADVGSGGDLGYTIGTYEMKMDGPDGPMAIVGKYITVWKKQADGTWMVAADMFNANGPPTPQM